MAGVLQLAVACYVFRVAQLFSVRPSARVLFSALSVLAIVSVVLPSLSFVSGVKAQTVVETYYALISVLMLGSMVNFAIQFKKHLVAESQARRAEFIRGAEADPQSTDLIRTNQQLQQTAARLEAEIAECRQSQERAEMICRELQERQAELSRANEELRQSAVRSQLELAEQTQTLMKIREAHQAETGRLVGSLLENLTAFQQAALERARTAKEKNPRGRKLPGAEPQTSDEPSRLLGEIDSVRKRLEQIKQTGTIPSATEFLRRPVPAVPPPPVSVSADDCRAGTETATQSADDAAPAPPVPRKAPAEPRRRVAKPKRVTRVAR
jgi:hypothetical protein